MSPLQRHRLIDRLGAYGSILCAVHCALLPIVIALLPSTLVALVGNDRLELAFVVFASAIGLFSLAWGYRRHRAVRALSLLLPGLAVLWFGVLHQPLHQSVIPHAIAMTIGGTLVGLAHLANLRLNHMHVHNATCAH